uniref:Uncharacterized protein n=1 Tax=Meloidogyne enterolobii TaxID=390850 RepID=A0A6V7VCN0_MELEN|nr:unnamed protein product [Meloidogyne enterolobii]
MGNCRYEARSYNDSFVGFSSSSSKSIAKDDKEGRRSCYRKEICCKKEHSEEPECDLVEISFDKRNYRLLTVSPITSTSKKPTLPTQGLPIMQQKTAPSSKGATKSPSKTTITKAKTMRASTTKDSSGSLFLVVIIVVVVIILAVIVIGIAVYFVFRKDRARKRKVAVGPNK